VNNNGDHAPEEKRGNIQLTAGDHAIVLTFYNNGAGFELAVSWRGPGFKNNLFPPRSFLITASRCIPLESEDLTVDRV
jgi:hypothetical protein